MTAPRVLRAGAGGWESPLLGIVTAVLLAFGVAAVYSASSIWAVQNHHPGWYFALRQLIAALVGGLMVTIVARLDYHVWHRLAWPIMLTTAFLLLVLVLPFAHAVAPIRNGARRWLALGGASFQPSEIANFAVVLWTAMIATKKGDDIRDFKRGLVPVGVIVLPVALLIAIEPDLSTAVLLVALAGLVLFAAGAKIGHFLLLGVVSVPIVWHEVTHVAYRAARLKGFLVPDDDVALRTTQIGQSLIGIGSGGLTGAGSHGLLGAG
ncbi:MAG TPA: FtsW/RodA/SpoVE family cell cycle protein, partial [Gemmatimonadales bacterium]